MEESVMQTKLIILVCLIMLGDNIILGLYELSRNMNWLCDCFGIRWLWVQTLVGMN